MYTYNLITTFMFSMLSLGTVATVHAMFEELKNKHTWSMCWYGLVFVYCVFFLINCPIFPWSVF